MKALLSFAVGILLFLSGFLQVLYGGRLLAFLGFFELITGFLVVGSSLLLFRNAPLKAGATRWVRRGTSLLHDEAQLLEKKKLKQSD